MAKLIDEDFEALCARRDANAIRIARLALNEAGNLISESAEKRELVAENESIEQQLRQELMARVEPSADWGDYAIECVGFGGERVLRIPMTAGREEVLSFASRVPLPPAVVILRVVRVSENGKDQEVWSSRRGT